MSVRYMVVDLRDSPAMTPLPQRLDGYGPLEEEQAWELHDEIRRRHGANAAAMVVIHPGQQLADQLSRDQLERELAAAERQVADLRRRLGHD